MWFKTGFSTLLVLKPPFCEYTKHSGNLSFTHVSAGNHVPETFQLEKKSASTGKFDSIFPAGSPGISNLQFFRLSSNFKPTRRFSHCDNVHCFIVLSGRYTFYSNSTLYSSRPQYNRTSCNIASDPTKITTPMLAFLKNRMKNSEDFSADHF